MTRPCQSCGAVLPLIADGKFRKHDCPAMPDMGYEYSDFATHGVRSHLDIIAPVRPSDLPLSHLEIEELTRGKCPDCGERHFFEGPRGGMSVNIACSRCGAEFNWCPTGPALSQRNGERGKPDRQRLLAVFGMRLP